MMKRLRCLVTGHDWDHFKYRTYYSKPYYNEYTDECRRCGHERHHWLRLW